ADGAEHARAGKPKQQQRPFAAAVNNILKRRVPKSELVFFIKNPSLFFAKKRRKCLKKNEYYR
ncbi:MAG: hypothetical protein K5982_00365, partial [Selenomonadaceae bacterium]|nr:hypothetical protein [Selenomonadaceae bacterium]